MSSEWQITTLGAICEAQGGAIQTGPFGSQLHTSDYKEFGVPVVMPTNIGEGGIDESGIARIDEADVERLSQHKLRLGDIVFSRRGDVTKNALIRPHEVGWLCGTGCLKVRLGNETIANSKFISHCLRLPDIREWLIRHAVGATMPNLNTGILSAVPINLPPLKEQLEIAETLGSLDDRITLLRETNATLEAIAQALFKSWFVDFDPVHANIAAKSATGGAAQGGASAAQGTTAGMPEAGQRRKPLPPMPAAALDAATAALFPDSFEESELGLVPRGWSYSTIGQSFILTMGQSPPGDTYNENGEGVPFYQGRTDFGFRFPKQRVFCTEPSRLAITGDTLVSVRAPVGDVNIALDECALGRGVASLRHPEGHQSFVFYAVRCLKPYFEMHDGEGTVFGSINKKDFQALPIVLPPENLLTSFESIVTPIDAAIENNEKKLRCLTQLRDTLLPRLISGQLRLPEAETLLETMP